MMKEILNLSNRIFMLRLEGFKDAIKKSDQVSEIVENNIAKRPYHINVIEAACHGRFKETGHSMVLGKFLEVQEFQKSFLKRFFGIDTNEKLEVYTEHPTHSGTKFGRIDILLKDATHYVIIENKVNDANETDEQLYTYVYGSDRRNHNTNNIYVLYLNSITDSWPSEYSRGKKHHIDIAKVLSDRFQVTNFKYGILDWLRELNIDNEVHIHSALDQYIDFLETKFHTSKLDKEMNDEIKDFLLNELKLKGESLEEQVRILEEQSIKAQDLQNALDSIITDLKKQISHNLMLSWQKDVEQLGEKISHDNHSFGIKLKYNVWCGIWDGCDNPKNKFQPYWGFYCESTTEGEEEEALQMVKKICEETKEIEAPDKFSKPSPGNGWIAWQNTQNGDDRIKKLWKTAKELGYM